MFGYQAGNPSMLFFPFHERTVVDPSPRGLETVQLFVNAVVSSQTDPTFNSASLDHFCLPFPSAELESCIRYGS
jgi:hypothetical protein